MLKKANHSHLQSLRHLNLLFWVIIVHQHKAQTAGRRQMRTGGYGDDQTTLNCLYCFGRCETIKAQENGDVSTGNHVDWMVQV